MITLSLNANVYYYYLLFSCLSLLLHCLFGASNYVFLMIRSRPYSKLTKIYVIHNSD